MKKGSRQNARDMDAFIVPVELFGKIKTSESPDRFSHFHENTELLYLKEGEMRVILNDKPFELHSGELIVVNPNEPHSLEPKAQECDCCIIKFSPEILSSQGYILPFTADTHPVFSREFVENSGIAALIADAAGEWEKKDTGFELAVKADVLKILRILICSFSEKGVDVRASATGGGIQSVIGDILQYVNENFRNVDERKTAEHFNISYSYFSRSFKSIMNRSFKDYVNYLKINDARKMLLETDKSIAEISSLLGFSSSSHFINVFGRLNGCSPKQYRKNIEKD